jgi:hypothetical protein
MFSRSTSLGYRQKELGLKLPDTSWQEAASDVFDLPSLSLRGLVRAALNMVFCYTVIALDLRLQGFFRSRSGPGIPPFVPPIIYGEN